MHLFDLSSCTLFSYPVKCFIDLMDWHIFFGSQQMHPNDFGDFADFSCGANKRLTFLGFEWNIFAVKYLINFQLNQAQKSLERWVVIAVWGGNKLAAATFSQFNAGPDSPTCRWTTLCPYWTLCISPFNPSLCDSVSLWFLWVRFWCFVPLNLKL